MHEQKTVEVTHEPARGRPARSRSCADKFSQFERGFRSVAAATGTIARRFGNQTIFYAALVGGLTCTRGRIFNSARLQDCLASRSVSALEFT